MISLSTQLLTVSILALQRQAYHNRGLYLADTSVWWNSSYDFVIVGAGSAGCVLASRLTEDANISVLLLEAGGPQLVITDIMNSMFAPEYASLYYSMPQKHSAMGNHNRRIYYPRGRLLGGSSAINDEVYSRGSAAIYDSWSTVYGASGWTFAQALPYFLRSENNTDADVVARNQRYHSTNGPLQVSTVPDADPIFGRWTAALNGLGWPSIDFNGPSQFGTGVMQTTQSRLNWTRQSTASAYIEPHIIGRSNLHVLLNSHATRITFDPVSPTVATGVQFVHNNRTHSVMANRELIISSGTFNTPQLLMLSGIGPRAHLEQLRIPVIADLPVGNNLNDHSIVAMDALVTNRSDITWASNRFYSFNVQNLFDLFVNNYGPLTRDPISETYLPTGVNGDVNAPDIVMYFQIAIVNPDINGAVAGFDQSNREEWKKYFQPFSGSIYHVNLNFNNFRPQSTGTVRLASTNPLDAPLIDPNFFFNPRDLDATVKGMSIGLRLAESSNVQSFLKLYSAPVPGCAQLCEDSRPMSQCFDYLRCVAQVRTGSTGHPVGTCRMGNSTNADAVVDERLRVRGLQRLRIVDASVIPIVPNSNCNAAVIMVAERAVDFIRQDHGLPL